MTLTVRQGGCLYSPSYFCHIGLAPLEAEGIVIFENQGVYSALRDSLQNHIWRFKVEKLKDDDKNKEKYDVAVYLTTRDKNKRDISAVVSAWPA
jgi:hypothetical protein